MKKYTGIIVAVVLLVAVIAAYFLLMNSEEPTESTPESISSVELNYLIDLDSEDVKSITVENEDNYTISVTQGDEGTVYSLEEDGHKYIDDAVYSAGIALISVLTEAEPIATTDHAQYGLDTPSATVTVEATSETITYLVGDAAPGESDYYAKLADSDEVWLISAADAGLAIGTRHQFRDYLVFSYETGTEADTFESFSLSRQNGPDISITTNTEPEEFASYYSMTAPVEHEANDTVLTEDVFTFFTTLAFSEIVEDNPADLEKYGIPNDFAADLQQSETTESQVASSEPAAEDTVDEASSNDTTTDDEASVDTTENTATDENTARATITVNGDLTITLGDYTDEAKTHYYATVSGIDSVVTFPTSAFPYLDIDYTVLLSSLLWLHNILDVDSVDIVTPNTQNTMELTHIEPEDEEGSASTDALLDGEFIEEDFAKDIYLAILSTTMSNAIEGEPDMSDVQYVFTINKSDGSSHTMEFYRINERQYGAIKNGQPMPFYVSVDLLVDVEEIVLGIKDGTHTG